jgi:hypothetical protein
MRHEVSSLVKLRKVTMYLADVSLRGGTYDVDLDMCQRLVDAKPAEVPRVLFT